MDIDNNSSTASIKKHWDIKEKIKEIKSILANCSQPQETLGYEPDTLENIKNIIKQRDELTLQVQQLQKTVANLNQAMSQLQIQREQERVSRSNSVSYIESNKS